MFQLTDPMLEDTRLQINEMIRNLDDALQIRQNSRRVKPRHFMPFENRLAKIDSILRKILSLLHLFRARYPEERIDISSCMRDIKRLLNYNLFGIPKHRQVVSFKRFIDELDDFAYIFDGYIHNLGLPKNDEFMRHMLPMIRNLLDTIRICDPGRRLMPFFHALCLEDDLLTDSLEHTERVCENFIDVLDPKIEKLILFHTDKWSDEDFKPFEEIFDLYVERFNFRFEFDLLTLDSRSIILTIPE